MFTHVNILLTIQILALLVFILNQILFKINFELMKASDSEKNISIFAYQNDCN